ncbi:TPA: GNAT family N-acetyltransferase [Legionella pneumophila]|nr:GNAT family N-acetyltransferase [Legionella pneumophila]
MNSYEIVFETDRLFFRKITMMDVENLQKIFSDPITMQYYPKIFNIEETKAWIQRVLNNYDKHGAGLWACHLKSTDEFVGQCGLFFQPNIDGQDEVEIGYLFVRKFWHQGLATEAACGTMNYAREKLGYKRLISLIRPENIPSRRVAGRNGFVPEKEITYKGYKHLVYVNEPNASNPLDLAQNIADRLGKIKGIEAVALGGSLARGEGHPDSDIDLGLYYAPNHPPSIKDLNQLASELNDSHAPNLITKIGEWGIWVNGGGWLNIKQRPVDWLYRDIALVSKVINDCQSGKTSCYYYPGHPHGFHDHYYLSEIYYCRALYDANGVLTSFKEQVTQYPPLLKKALIKQYLWEADFSIRTSLKAAKRDDVFYVTGSLFRGIACLIQVLFALNERYFINEKGSIQVADSLAIRPDSFSKKVTDILDNVGINANELLLSINRFESLVSEMKTLVDQHQQLKF